VISSGIGAATNFGVPSGLLSSLNNLPSDAKSRSIERGDGVLRALLSKPYATRTYGLNNNNDTQF
jgi:hypothetical protein